MTTTKDLERNIGKNVQELLVEEFWHYTKSTIHQRKIKRTSLSLKGLLWNSIKTERSKTSYRGGNNICKSYTETGLISRIYIPPKSILKTSRKWAKTMKEHFTKEIICMAKTYVKRCSVWLLLRRIKIKTMILLWECKTVQPLWKIICQFLWNLNMHRTYGWSITLLGIYLTGMKDIWPKKSWANWWRWTI